MYTSYYYEATSMLKGINLSLSSTYHLLSIISVVLCSLLAFALVMFTAIAIKRARIYGILVALLQPASFVAAWQVVVSYANVDFSCLEMTVTGSSQQDAMNKLYTAIGEAFLTEVFPQLIGCMIWAVVFAVISLFTLLYLALLIKGKKKAFAILALVIGVIRQFCISPLELVSTVLLGIGNQWIQLVWDAVFRGAMLLPLFLIALQGVFVLIGNIKAKKAAAAELDGVAAEYAAEGDAAPVEVVEAPEGVDATAQAADEEVIIVSDDQ